MENVFYYCFHEAFVKNVMKKLSISNKNVYHLLRYVILHNFSMWNFLVLKWRLFQYITKFFKNVPFIVIVTRLSWKVLLKNYDLLVPSCEICKMFKKTFFTEHLRMTASAVGLLFIGMCNIWKVLLLVTVHLFLLKLFSVDLNFFRYVSDCAQKDFSFYDF